MILKVIWGIMKGGKSRNKGTQKSENINKKMILIFSPFFT